MTGKYVNAHKLEGLVRQILIKNNVPPNDAETTADCLVSANLRGVDTHGVIRLRTYIDRIRAGGINPTPSIITLREDNTTAVLDGDNSLGPVGGTRAMLLAIRKAVASGVGIVTIRNSNHYGMAGYYAMMALKHDMVGISMTNVLASMPPTGGREARIGNNAFALAFPAGNEPDIVFDAATSISSWGKLYVAAQKGEPLPEGCFLDSNGIPTISPEEVLKGGFLLPIADHKGYGIALCISILTGLLSGGVFDTQIVHPVKHLSSAGRNAFFMMAFRVDRFVDLTEFKNRMDDTIRLIRSTKLKEGIERIWLPGEKEYETEVERRQNGIPLNQEMVKTLKELACGSGIGWSL